MVYITHKGENLEKISQIIERAQKRFGLYGFEKTAMREIADDLGMSKGILYYYFPDKEYLYKAVIEKEQSEFICVVNERMHLLDDPADKLREYVRIRVNYFRSLLNLGRLRYDEFRNIKPLLNDIWIIFKEKETKIIKSIFINGKKKGHFNFKNAAEMASLYLEILRGLRNMILSNKEILYLNEEEFELFVKKTNLFTELFIKSLKFHK